MNLSFFIPALPLSFGTQTPLHMPAYHKTGKVQKTSGVTLAETKTITYVFRRPRFPLICEIDGRLIGAQSAAEFRRRLARLDLSSHKKFTAIDAKGERWMLLPDMMAVAPEFAIRPARKIEIIRLFNESHTAKDAGLSYPEHVIGNRRLDIIVHDLVVLIGRAK
jgi:hypothetical protein